MSEDLCYGFQPWDFSDVVDVLDDFMDLYDKDVTDMERFTGRTVERWKQHAMLPDDITVVNLRF